MTISKERNVGDNLTYICSTTPCVGDDALGVPPFGIALTFNLDEFRLFGNIRYWCTYSGSTR